MKNPRKANDLIKMHTTLNEIMKPPFLLRPIRAVYPHVSRPGKHAPYDGYDVAGAFLCFCRRTQISEAPGWMRFPTAGDFAECLVDLGWENAVALDAARCLCDLCDHASFDQAWNYLFELLVRTPFTQRPHSPVANPS